MTEVVLGGRYVRVPDNCCCCLRKPSTVVKIGAGKSYRSILGRTDVTVSYALPVCAECANHIQVGELHREVLFWGALLASAVCAALLLVGQREPDAQIMALGLAFLSGPVLTLLLGQLLVSPALPGGHAAKDAPAELKSVDPASPRFWIQNPEFGRRLARLNGAQATPVARDQVYWPGYSDPHKRSPVHSSERAAIGILAGFCGAAIGYGLFRLFA